MRKATEHRAERVDVLPPTLVEAARAGSKTAIAELYERTYPMLYRTIRSMVRDEDLTWDILQDSYVRAFRCLDKLEHPEAFLPWLRRIAVNIVAGQMAKAPLLTFSGLDRGERWELTIPDPDPEGQPELALERRETSRQVRKLLAELPQEQLVIMGMYYYEEMSIKEIAEALRLAPGTVKAQLHRGRKRLEAGLRDLEQQARRDRRTA